ncbi:beta-galactosidase small subunit [Agrilactobacillus fermenti]|uniref:beta-galactosidase small subunit n=1 Tax=Agrilactobacillus fermenti TaxID=2586909 RepID=UPI003A5BA3AE
MANSKPLQIIYGDGTLGVTGPNCHYIFNYSRGGLESLVYAGKEWLYREPKPTFWRASTDNDRGNGFPQKASQWLGAELFSVVKEIALQVNQKPISLPLAPANNRYTAQEFAEEIQISFTYETPTVPTTQVTVTYTVRSTGQLHVQAHYHGNRQLPELPRFGLEFVMPTLATGFKYAGLSGETYPDRMAGGVSGTYQIQGLPVTPYLVPQDNGIHMASHWLQISRQSTKDNSDLNRIPFQLKFSQGQKPFAFSALPYTALELENASHQEDLPLPRRTVVTILGAVRGVGGIDSWGADVAPAYRIPGDQDIIFDFNIAGV